MSDTRAPRLLVATADLGGNGPPALGIAARLAADGADVHVIGHDRQRSAVAASGLGFTAYTRDRNYDALAPRSVPSAIRGLTGLSCDAGIAADLLETAAHDLPLLMLPMHPMVDQPTVARVVTSTAPA